MAYTFDDYQASCYFCAEENYLMLRVRTDCTHNRTIIFGKPMNAKLTNAKYQGY